MLPPHCRDELSDAVPSLPLAHTMSHLLYVTDTLHNATDGTGHNSQDYIYKNQMKSLSLDSMHSMQGDLSFLFLTTTVRFSCCRKQLQLIVTGH